MKKAILLSAALLTASVCGISVNGEESTAPQVYVTIADENGVLALAQTPVVVTDADQDGVLTMSDALYLAHEANYPGGAAAGYAAEETSYGVSLAKLWGCENGGSYGYYKNNASPISLADLVTDGDYINAFVYTDLTAWSDTYCFFDQNSLTAEAGDTVQLQLSYAGFDETWAPVTLPLSGATITLNGEKTAFVTDETGGVSVVLDVPGEVTISAVSDTQILVPPVCLAAVAGETTTAETTTTTVATTVTTITTAAATTAKPAATTAAVKTEAPKTGDSFSGLLALAGLTTLGGVFARRRNHAK